MLFTLRVTSSAGRCTLPFTATDPVSTVPVSTVPWPLIAKQWSTAIYSGASTGRLGTLSVSDSVASSAPMSASPALPHAVYTMGTSAPNLVPLKVWRRPFSRRSRWEEEGRRSALLATTMSCSVSISPSTRHSAVCVWMPLAESSTSSMRSMICAPPMMVRMREEWPGTVHDGELHERVQGGERGWVGKVEGGEAEVEGDAALLTLRGLVQGGGGEVRAEGARQARLAAVHVPDDAHVDIKHAMTGDGACHRGGLYRSAADADMAADMQRQRQSRLSPLTREEHHPLSAGASNHPEGSTARRAETR